MSTDSVIHDIGYQRYAGERLGAGYATRSLYVHGLRSIYGFGRSAKAKIFPWAIVAILGAVAVIDIAIRAQSQNAVMPITYVAYTNRMAVLLLFFTAVAAPELVSRDLRNKVLPLYFSRPLSRAQYAWAKLGALVTGLFALYAAPLTVIFAAGAFGLPTWKERGHEFNDYLGGLGAAAIFAIFFASIGLFIASLLSRRMIASAVIVGWALISTAIGGIIAAILQPDTAGGAVGFGIGQMTDIIALNDWIYHTHDGPNPEYGVVYLVTAAVYVVLTVSLLQLRYRKVSA